MSDQNSSPVIVKSSSIFSINWRDFLNGLVMAVGGAVFTVIENSIELGNFTFNWTNIWHIALGAFVIYIGKNFFTPGVTKVKGLQVGQTVTITAPPEGKTVDIPKSDVTSPPAK